jgi:signal transduction histidine kinase
LMPLATLAERAESGQSDFHDVPASGIKEVESLKRAMVRASHAHEEQRRSESEREQARLALTRAHDQLLEVDRRKNEFLATLGHELRNPFAAIGNAANVLSRLKEPDAGKARLYELITRQTRHVARLLDDLLDVGRLSHGKLRLEMQPVRLDVLLRRVAEDMQPFVERKRLRLTLDTPVPVVVDGDSARLSQVITNLLDNAIKYTPEGGRIELSVGVDGDQAVLRVSDTGEGISRELMPRIFEPFAQQEQSIERSQGGLGLGLAIVQRLVQMHGGQIHARSGGPDLGTEMVVRLPLGAGERSEG